MSEEFDFESIKNKALEQLKSGKPLLGKDGAFAPLLESILNAALEGEMDAHLSEDERMSGNRRNGKMQKQVQTSMGEVTVSTPRDRNSTFDPQFIKKRETILAEGVADRIIGLYALGNSTREISDWMEENLGNRVSAETISAITDRVLPSTQAMSMSQTPRVCKSVNTFSQKFAPSFLEIYIPNRSLCPSLSRASTL
jgi:putative transposase